MPVDDGSGSRAHAVMLGAVIQRAVRRTNDSLVTGKGAEPARSATPASF